MTNHLLRFRRNKSSTSLCEDSDSAPRNIPRIASPTSSPSQHRIFSTLTTLWPHRVLSTFWDPVRTDTKGRNGSLESNEAQPVILLSHDIAALSLPKIATSPRLPRHVPIVIPDFAQPYAPRPQIRPQSTITPGESVRQLGELVDSSSRGEARARSLALSPRFDKPEPTSIFSEIADIMNSSQVSLSASESGLDQPSGPTQPLNGVNTGSMGIISPISQSGAGGANLSALVCNVQKTTGQEPHALVGATTTILGDKLYVFGGRVHSRSRPQLTADLYELDLIRRHWTKLDVTGEIPPPRYFHSVCALGDTKLVCYGGMSPAPHLRNQANGSGQRQSSDTQPEVVVMSDIHVFDVPKKRWVMIIPSSLGTDGPQGRYAHCAAIVPSSAVFTSPSAPHSAIHHNKTASDPHSGTLGVQLDGTGGAEMVVIGGQDSANNYIEQISIFNLRSLRWTSITEYDRKCGAYKSMVAPLIGLNGENLGRGFPLDDPSRPQAGTSMLIYSNYNFLDVKLELQVRLPDGTLLERRMASGESPPGLRFPNGGVINSHLVVSGTYLTSSKHEYALWALDLRTLAWHRIDTAGSVFSTGSWNRGILWNRRNQFVILGHRKRNLVDDYNHRRINFSHVCMVELEAFGLYDNPRKMNPSSSYVSRSAPVLPEPTTHQVLSSSAGGRQLSNIAEQLGQTALAITELCDMELIAMGGEKVPCNSQILSKRWGPFFNHILNESCGTGDSRTLSDATTLRANMHSQASRNSTVTITQAGINGVSSSTSLNSPESQRSISQATAHTLVDPPDGISAPASSRLRSLYLPHAASTLKLFLHYLYTSSLPPLSSPLCTPHILCSLLQMARPYQVDGLLEATVQRLHEALDGRNAAAVFNAAAMAAGGGRALGMNPSGTLAELERRSSEAAAAAARSDGPNSENLLTVTRLRAATGRGHQKSNSVDSNSTTTTASQTDTESSARESDTARRERTGQELWTGEMSGMIGLQKRGLKGLMEGRRMRERSNTGGAGDP